MAEEMDLKKFHEPFPRKDIEWRIQRCGQTQDRIWAIVAAYITNRAIMERLDTVCGPENWHNEFVSGPAGGVLCGISIRIGDAWVTKWDGADNTDIEPIKGGLTGAMKRAAVQWGIGRYLYDLEAQFAKVSDRGKHDGQIKDGPRFKWDSPKLPDWALPEAERKAQAKAKLAEKKQPEDEGIFDRTARFKAAAALRWEDKSGGDLSVAAGEWVMTNYKKVWAQLSVDEQEESIQKLSAEAIPF